jgi:RHS repeat-associated protein
MAFGRAIARLSHIRIMLGLILAMTGVLVAMAVWAQADPPAPPELPADTWVPNGRIQAAVPSDHGTLYIGGTFTHVGPYTGHGVAFSDSGEREQFPVVNGAINAATPDGSGGWYIGGSFTRVGSATRNRLAHVLATGEVDPNWNPGASANVGALARIGSTLYVGGDFTTVGGQARYKLAAVDATGAVTSWNPGMTSSNSEVYALAVSDSTIYFGGRFSTIAGQSRANLAAVDTSGALTSWNPNAGSYVNALAVSGSTVYAGGLFNSIGGQVRNRLAAIDATTGAPVAGWNPAPNSTVLDLAVTDSMVYVAGNFGYVGPTQRNGVAAIDKSSGSLTAWNANANGSVTALAVAGSKLYLGGPFTAIGGETRNRLAAVDLSTAQPTTWDPSTDASSWAIAASPDSVLVGGDFTTIGGKSRTNLAEIDLETGVATDWNPRPSSTVNALARSGSTVYVGGEFLQIAGVTRNRLAAVDAAGNVTSWNPSVIGGSLQTLALSGSTLYAGGNFTGAGGQTRNRLASFDLGSGNLNSWNPGANGQVNAVTVDGSTVYAGGKFTSIGGQTRNYLAALDSAGAATSWNPAPNTWVNAIATAGTQVYVGGLFTTIAGQSRARLAAINADTGTATSWSPSASSEVFALMPLGSTIYVGGSFTTAGGQPRNGLASIDLTTGDATDWNPNIGNAVRAFATTGASVYAGGEFTTMGPSDRPNLGAFPVAPTNTTPPELSANPVVGQPVSTSDGTWTDAARLTYEWLRGGNAITGATSHTYTPTSDDTGRELKARVTAKNLAGSAMRDTAAPVVEGQPVSDSAPAIAGTPRVGKLLTGSDGSWRSSPTASTARQWRRCDADGANCTDIAGETGDTYRLGDADLGNTVRFRVEKSNVHGAASAVSAATDVVAPSVPPYVVLAHSPALANGWTASYDDTLTVTATDASPGVANLEVSVDGQLLENFTHACATEAVACPGTLGHDFVLSGTALADGAHTFEATARDGDGNLSDPESYTVKLDRLGPTLTTAGALKEAAGELVGGRDELTLDVSATDATAGVRSVEILVDGERAAYAEQECAAGDCGFEGELTVDFADFGPGEHTIRVVAADFAGHEDAESWQLSTTDGLPPVITLSGSLADAEGQSITPDKTYELHAVASDGSAEAPQSGVRSLEILVGEEQQRLVQSPCQNGNCSLEADYVFDPAQFATGGHTVRIRAEDESGETEERTMIVIVHRPPAAPELDTTSVPSLADSTDFLYEADGSVQTGVTDDAIDDEQAAVVRGRVLTADGAPLPGVEVSVKDRPEFGSTLSRADGEVYLAVAGGETLTLQFERPAQSITDAYLPAQRAIEVPWQGYAQFEDVRLLKPGPVEEAIDLSGSSLAYQTYQGTRVVDGRGSRQPVLLFPPGTHARAELPDGSSEPLGQAHVRVTEYTVGAGGQQAMPGALPPHTAYTYAAEFAVDEAEALDAETVRFTDALGAPQPVISYNENFLDFDVGTPVPYGYFDEEKGAWLPEESGVIVKVLDHAGGRAVLDVTGSGQAATTGELADLGITDEELEQVAALYQPGTELWRVRLEHFTPGDLNQAPNVPGEFPNVSEPPRDPDDQCVQAGSVIGCEGQTLGEEIPIVGTGQALAYSSERVPGRAASRTLKIPLSGSSMPATDGIRVTIEVAGRTFSQSYAPAPNLTHTFTWDGKDEFGRTVQGTQEATVKITYWSGLNYGSPTWGVFGSPAGEFEYRAMPGEPFQLSQVLKMPVSNWDAREIGLGGWTLTDHHAYDPEGRILHLGNGSRISADGVGHAIRMFAGGGSTCFPTEGQPALATSVGSARLGEIAPDGTVYFATAFTVYKIDPQGVVQRVAGHRLCPPVTNPDHLFGGDGGPATDAYLDHPYDMVVDGAGGLYIADRHNRRVRYVDSSGVIRTVAGGGSASATPEGVPALEVSLSTPEHLSLGADGTLYISDTGTKQIVALAKDGYVRKIAGAIESDGSNRALQTAINPYDLEIAPNGEIFFVNGATVDKIRVDGKLRRVAGGGSLSWPQGEGEKATNSKLSGPHFLELGPDGTLYVDDGPRVRQVTSDGLITTAAGSTSGRSGIGGPPTAARISCPAGMALNPTGSLIIADSCQEFIVSVGSPMPGPAADGNLKIPSSDGNELFEFDARGRHLRTFDALTGAVTRSFSYDAAGHLTQITDGDGDQTTIERDASGRATAIVSADGDRTLLTLNAGGALSEVENPAGEKYELGYGPGTLLESFTDPRNNASTFEYDGLGRLVRDTDAAGGFKTLTRTDRNDGHDVTVETKLGRETKYEVQAQRYRGATRTVTDAAGLETTREDALDGTSTVTAPDGTKASRRMTGDPRFGTQAPVLANATLTTPDGRSQTLTATRTVQSPDLKDPLALTSLTDTVTVTGRNWTSVFNRAQGTFTNTSPTGRAAVTTVDAQRRPVSQTLPGIAGLSYTYDARGRPTGVSQGTRTSSVTYDGEGNVATSTDALGRVTSYAYDAAGRVTSETQPGGRTTAYSYDAAGNLTSVTPPGRTAHTFSFSAVDLATAYDPPALGETALPRTEYTYNDDRELTKIERPDRAAPITFNYDDGGRLASTTTPTGPEGASEATTYGYSTGGALRTVGAPNGQTLTFTSDGPLPLEQSFSGPVAGQVNYAYDTNLRLSAETINGSGSTVDYGYDNDNLLTSAGALTIIRDPIVDGVAQRNGLIASTALDQVQETRSYDGYGDQTASSFTYGSSPLFSSTATRDAGGRIESKAETTAAGSTTHAYVYAPEGWLTDASTGPPGGATTTTHYEYDANGNRTQRTRGGETTYYTYDAQDRLTRAGTVDYSYDENGQLTRRQDSADASDDTRFGYDPYGQLTNIELPDGRAVSYVIDGFGRRVARKVDGQRTDAYLYGDGISPIAELNADNSLKTRFVYATRSHVPDFMVRGGTTYRFITDQLGSPRLVANASTGEVAQELEYDEFGVVTRDTNPGFQPFGYAGGLYDRETGLVHFGAREYDPEVGRWTAKDPIDFDGGDTNLYGYVFSDPVNLIDPTGLYGWSDFKHDTLGTFGNVDDVIWSGESAEFLGNEIVAATNTVTLGQSNRLLGINGECLGIAGTIGSTLTYLVPAAAVVRWAGPGARYVATAFARRASGSTFGRKVGRIGYAAAKTRLGSKLFGRSPRGVLNTGYRRIGLSKHKGKDYFSGRIGQDHYPLYP